MNLNWNSQQRITPMNKNEGNSSFAYCNKCQMATEYKSNCSSVKPKCENCFYNDLTPDHYYKCRSCQLVFAERIQQEAKCFACIKSPSQISLPMCSEHKYCFKCFNDYVHVKLTCSDCACYFKSYKNPKECFICSTDINLKNTLKCINHSICNKCLEYLNEHELIQLNDLNNCEKCKYVIRPELLEEKKINIDPYNLNLRNNRCIKCSTLEIHDIKLKLCYNCYFNNQKSYALNYDMTSNEVNNDNCIICRTRKKSYNNHCAKAESMCEDCSFNTLTSIHYHECKLCQSAFEKKIKYEEKCFSCIKGSGESYLPMCNQHKYCMNCLQQPKFSKTICDLCSNYFNPQKSTLRCFFCCCYDNSQSQNFCGLHTICILCLKYLQDHESLKIEELSKCRICSKKIKPVDKTKTETEIVNSKLLNEDIPSEIERPNLSVYVSNSITPSFLNPGRKNLSKENTTNSDILYSTVQASRTDYDTNPAKLNYESLNPRRSSLDNSMTPGASYKFNNQLWCNYCNAEVSITTLLCKHNYCLECILALACLKIYEFFTSYNNGANPEILMNSFFYICQINSCGIKVRIPILLIKKYLYYALYDGFIPKQSQYFMQMRDIYVSIYRILSDSTWILYLDGIKVSHAFPSS